MNWTGYWIWHPDMEDGENQYIDFRNMFAIENFDSDIFLHFSVDSDCVVFINGNFAGWNQYPDWPKNKTYSTFNITKYLKLGKNCIAVRAYCKGEDFATYAKGRPGLLVSILDSKEESILVSDSSWKCRRSPVYLSGPVSKVTVQLGYTFQYDATKEDNWQFPDFDSSKWEDSCQIVKATEGFWREIKKRPISNLKIYSVIPAQLIASGHLIRKQDYATVAKTVMEDAIVTKSYIDEKDDKTQVTFANEIYLNGNKPYIIDAVQDDCGHFLLLDLAKEESGLLTIDVDAPCGTVLDIAHGEHITDLRVRAEISGRNFADRYICKAKRQKWFYPFRRLGCRYLEIHIPRITGQIKIYNISLQPVVYPFNEKGKFKCNDSFFNRLWDISIRTLRLCAHDHYEDCPWREQALYAYDSRLQAMYGYYAFGDYEYAKSNFDLMGEGLRDDGLIELNAPANVPVNIPIFSLHWICALYEDYLFSGDSELINKYLNAITDILDKSLERMTSDGIVENSEEPSHWHFYEWSTGLEGQLSKAIALEPVEQSCDAIYNLLLISALKGMAGTGRDCNIERLKNYQVPAEKIISSFHNYFWDNDKQAYASFKRKGGFSNYAKLTQAMALLENVVPESSVGLLVDKLKKDRSLIEAGLPSLRFIYDALLKNDRDNLGFVLEDIRDKFETMIYSGASSLWETLDGDNAFLNAGSLCHAWSALFIYIAGAYVLGVKPQRLGFKDIAFEPDNKFLSCFSGCVPTPYGKIEIKKVKEKIFINKPENIEIRSAKPMVKT